MSEQAGRYVLLINEDMEGRCFPGELRAELDGLYPWTIVRSAGDLSEDEWHKLLRGCEIICGPWGVRQLPQTSDPEDLPAFLCYMSGAVGNFADETHLELGMRLTNWGDSIAHTIAESALTGILACQRRVGYNQHVTHDLKKWRDHESPDSATLFEKRVGLIGLGQIGRQMPPLLAPFRCDVYAYDPYVPDEVLEGLGVTRVASLEELFDTCPIISNHAGRVEELAGKIDAAMLARLPDEGVFVNTARGRILVEDALADEHEAGRLWSCLDVFDPEPPPAGSRLRATPRCIITPHQAGPTKDSYPCKGRRAIENLKRWKAGEELLGEVTPEMLPRMT